MIRRIIVGAGIVLAVLAVLYFVAVPKVVPTIPDLPDLDEGEQIQVHTIVVEEVQGLGKLELSKITYQDIMTHEIQVDYFPDPKVMLKVYGETVACIDFTLIDSADIHVTSDTLYLRLPSPEICYARIDHERSEIVETWYTALYAEGQKLIDQAYELAENKMRETALRNDIFGKAKSEAHKTLQPLLESLTQKQVKLVFETPLVIPPQPTFQPELDSSRPSVIRE